MLEARTRRHKEAAEIFGQHSLFAIVRLAHRQSGAAIYQACGLGAVRMNPPDRNALKLGVSHHPLGASAPPVGMVPDCNHQIRSTHNQMTRGFIRVDLILLSTPVQFDDASARFSQQTVQVILAVLTDTVVQILLSVERQDRPQREPSLKARARDQPIRTFGQRRTEREARWSAGIVETSCILVVGNQLNLRSNETKYTQNVRMQRLRASVWQNAGACHPDPDRQFGTGGGGRTWKLLMRHQSGADVP